MPKTRRCSVGRRYYELALAELDAGGDPDERVEVVSEHAAALNSTACVLQELECNDDAVEPLKKSLKMYEEVLGPDHAFVGVGQHNLGLVLWGSGKLDEAKRALETSVRCFAPPLSRTH